MTRNLLTLILCCGLGSACSRPPAVPEPEARIYTAAFENAVMTVDVQQKWARSCALCHVNGEGGAPGMGDREVWAERIALGDALLMKHTLEGYNRMPALGYCMDCELTDFAAMINLMAGKQ